MSRRFPIRTILVLTVLVTLVLGAPVVTVTCVRGIGPRVVRAYVRTDLEVILAAAERFRAVHGSYPRDLAELVAYDDGAGTDAVGFCGLVPTDTWGRPYEYRVVRGRPVVRSLGSDGVAGGSGEAADITLSGADSAPVREPVSQRRSTAPSPPPSPGASGDSPSSGRARTPR